MKSIKNKVMCNLITALNWFIISWLYFVLMQCWLEKLK